MKSVWFKVWLASAAFVAAPALHAGGAEYRLGIGDVVRISVYGNADLATEARVGDDGTLSFPLIGAVEAAGQTPAATEKRIAGRLAKGGFIVDPSVNLNVIQYRGQQVSVLGRVNRPGKYALEKTSRVAEVLAQAGGIVTDGADTVTLVRTRDGKTEYREIDVPALFRAGGEADNVELEDGDVLHVARQPMFFIYGEVQRPGSFRLEQGMSVVQALSMGGGLTPRGTQRGIRVLRRDDQGGMQEIDVSLADTIKKDDVIYVKESLF
ncbi:MAG: polysaccharide export protein EpsE [Hydrogenophilales bacterium 16-64-46]|nr:MAG: polysaccharide export protein EpsE [Hydrogenophilales bacterium 12-64-13]OYZ04382.1 MAG: polysaccharide export protein EpsE [Hydrogenophilales bacterium 16-64-46]OZA38253.1 MAG: polysaccharide export protein EpsE [Hydrogenophilales bacterium 17-64-34]HQS99157.1 polysaccharide export protein EpsE [Thiobacillus sp.]